MELRITLLIALVAPLSAQLLDAYLGKTAPRKNRARLDATLDTPNSQWDDAADQPPPHTLATTSHYSTGHAAAPGVHAVARRDDDPRLLPAEHKLHTPHPDASAAVDPAAARHHATMAVGAEQNAWHAHAATTEARLHLRGLPPQPVADWAWPDQPAVRLREGVRRPSEAAGSQATEWGDEPSAELSGSFFPRPPPSTPPPPSPPPAAPPPSPKPPAVPGDEEWLVERRRGP